MLETGDRAPQFLLDDVEGRPHSAVENRVAGYPVILLFSRDATDAFSAFAERIGAFKDRGATLFVISGANVALNRSLQQVLGPDLVVLADKELKTFESYGCDNAAIYVLDLDSRVLDAFLPEGGAADADRALAGTDAALRVAPVATLSMHAPVLIIPRVLDADACRLVIDAWEHLDKAPVEGRGAKRNDASTAFFDTYGLVRQHVPHDPKLLAYLDQRLPRRLGLEIRKAFQTGISQREDYRIACYEGASRGSLGPHRDNMTEATGHRRFTASIQLNTTEYTGGELCFPEYGRQLYRGETGAAIVFSASLLHEVRPVTSGRRFMLGTHLFGN